MFFRIFYSECKKMMNFLLHEVPHDEATLSSGVFAVQ